VVDFIETLPKAAMVIEYRGEGPISDISPELRSRIRRMAGSPDFSAGGTWTPVTNNVFLFSNAMIQGYRSDWEAGTDPKTRSGFWWKKAAMNLLPKFLLLAAGYGLLGDRLKRLTRGVTEYDKTNYVVIPLSEDDQGNVVYLRLPQDESGRLMGGLAWKALSLAKGDKDILATLAQVVDYSGGQFPTVTPVISTASNVLTYASGRNPYDNFRSRSVLTDDEQKARGFQAFKKFVGWEFQQLGGGVVWKFYPGEERPATSSTGQKILDLPVFSNIAGRFIRITNAGDRETVIAAGSKVAADEARRRLSEKSAVNAAIKTFQKADARDRTTALTTKLAKDISVQIYGNESHTNDLVKKLHMGVVRGGSDPIVDAILSATSNDQKAAILAEYQKAVGASEFKAWIDRAQKEGVITADVMNKLQQSKK
jgi:hypothetical protein